MPTNGSCSLTLRVPATSTEPFPLYGIMPYDYANPGESVPSSLSAVWTWCTSSATAQRYAVLWSSAEESDAEFVQWQTLLSALLPERNTQAIRTLVQGEMQVMQQMEVHRQTQVVYINGWPSQSHEDLFRAEDRYPDVWAYSDAIRMPLSNDEKAHVESEISMCGYIMLRLKDYFQRARPYQTARMLDFPLKPLASGSAATPALPSGHALQTMCAFAATYEVLVVRPNASAFDASAWRALMRYAYDIGDRRVVAGVHYPTDNYASSMIFNRIVARAWPRAHAAGMRFAESAAERRVLCGRAFPELCLEPVLNTSAALATLNESARDPSRGPSRDPSRDPSWDPSTPSPPMPTNGSCSLPLRVPATSTEPFPLYGIMPYDYANPDESVPSSLSAVWTWCTSSATAQRYAVLWSSAEESDAEFVQWQTLLSALLPERNTQAIRTLVQGEMQVMQQMEVHRQTQVVYINGWPSQSHEDLFRAEDSDYQMVGLPDAIGMPLSNDE